jgi:hypothetical protein
VIPEAGRALVIALLVVAGSEGRAQDTTVAPRRHILPFDTTRVQPFRRFYDIIVHGTDSANAVGTSALSLEAAVYAGAPAWLLIETRTGVVPSVESLYVAPDLRPLHWSSTLGAARLGTEFVRDSIYGAVTGPSGKHNIVLAGRPDLMVSAPMVAMVLPLLPLSAQWADSVGVMTVDLASSAVSPAELVVVGEEDFVVDSTLTRPTWVVALRADSRNVLFWVDREIPAVLRVQQLLPPHVGRLLEYRLRPEIPAAPATLPP